ncbi:MAG: pectate lyase [Bacteroidales bacterium]|nr:pectate lyase [Bacteroidales bacterium]
MKKTSITIALLWLTSLVFPSFAQTLPAFPGAEGHGRYTSGGRGGAIYHVTNLEDDKDNPPYGSLRYCLNKSGARTIVFDVAGTIFLDDYLDIKQGNVTIAGQTAPGEGICIAGYPVRISSSNVIMRFIRVRMGDLHLEVEDDALGGRAISNVIVDHCSCSWSIDECVSFYGDKNFTMQWCIISESLRYSNHEKGGHGYGGIWGGPSASFHHNLLAHHSSRTPRLGHDYQVPEVDNVDLRNNVIYNYGAVVGAYGAEGMNANIINCYYKPGPSTKPGSTRRSMIMGINPNDPKADNYDPNRPKWGEYFVSGNWCSSRSDIYATPTDAYERACSQDNWNYGIYNSISASITAAEKKAMRRSQPLDAGLVTTHSAQNAFEKVLATAGCSLDRDIIDERIVKETREGKATFKGNVSKVGGIIDSQNDLKPSGAPADWSAWPSLEGGEKPKDTDQDGMPDEWEEAQGLNPKYPLDRNNKHASGYTYLEVYINSLVEHIVKAELSDFDYIAGGDANDFVTNLPSVQSEASQQQQVWFDLQGRPTDEPQQSGIYIGRNKKTIIK